MLTRTLLTRPLTSPAKSRLLLFRCLSTPPTQRPQDKPPKSWLTRKLEASPAAKQWFLSFTNLLGYGSPKQLAGRRAFVLYEQIVAAAPDQYPDFWQKECHLPPTFQSWFTVTNLHIWLLTVRLRALPKEHGRHYIQALIDHYFLDIEDRIRAVLQPPANPTPPYTFISPFYINPNAPKLNKSSSSSSSSSSNNNNNNNNKTPPEKRRIRAPDRIVTRQMKIFKEQWAGLGLSFDLALVRGDAEMAGAVWRNLLGARGSRGIAYPTTTNTADADPRNQTSPAPAPFRRAVNLVGGEVVNVAKIDIEKEETKDDGSGVHDFPPAEIDKYVRYPELMFDIVSYVRRELVRLENVSDHDIMAGDWRKLRFGPVKQNDS